MNQLNLSLGVLASDELEVHKFIVVIRDKLLLFRLIPQLPEASTKIAIETALNHGLVE